MAFSSQPEVKRLLDTIFNARAEDVEQYEAPLREALDRFPDDPTLCLQTARAIRMTAPDEAAQLAARAVAIAPDDPWYLTRAASLMFLLKKFDQAQNYGKRAAQIASDNFPLVAELAFVAGRLAMHKGNDVAAEEGLSLAFEREPEGPGYGRVLAELYASQGRYKDALTVVTKALEYRENDQLLIETRKKILAMDPR